MCDECEDANDKLLQQIRNEKGNPSPAAAKQKSSNALRTNNTGKINEMASYITNLESEIGKLKDIITHQSSTINQLSTKLNFVLSYLEINSDDNKKDVCSDDNKRANDDNSNDGTTDGETRQSANISSSITRNNSSSVRRITATTAAVAAVYIEEQTRRRRASTLIVSGLSVDDSLSDQDSFNKLCEDELTSITNKPEVVFTKRLGKKLDNKIQPLLVCFRNETDARQILERARDLRRSNNEHIRTNVYINPNRTRAEAEADYQLRCKRRNSKANIGPQIGTTNNDQVLPLLPQQKSNDNRQPPQIQSSQ